MFDTLTVVGIIVVAVFIAVLVIINMASRVDKELEKYDGQD